VRPGTRLDAACSAYVARRFSAEFPPTTSTHKNERMKPDL
jgi:hypothetical protein